MARKRYKPKRRIRPRRSRIKRVAQSRLFWFGVIVLFALGGAGYGVFLTPVFQIKHVEIQGNQKIPAGELRQIAKGSLERRFGFFGVNNFLLVDTALVAENMRAMFPELESVVAKKRFPDALKIVVKERQGIALWCQERMFQISLEDAQEEKSHSFRECFLLDKQGIIFEKKEPEREPIFSAPGAEVLIGGRAVDPDVLENALKFQRALDASVLFSEVGLRVPSVLLVSKTRAHAEISEGWEIYINTEENIDWQIQKVKLVLEQEIPFQKRPFLEYIDVRFGDQAYIKYRK